MVVVTIDVGVFVPTSFGQPSHLHLKGHEASLSVVEGVEASFRAMVSIVPLYLAERTISRIKRERNSVSQFVTWRSRVKLESLSVSEG